MRGLVKYIVGKTYKPLLVKYLSKTRSYSYRGVSLEVPPEVFHPGFFFSTRLLLRYVAREQLEGKSFLELGAGSGLISIYAAKRGADVVATDINPVALQSIENNAELNEVEIGIVYSDVFDRIIPQAFDFIIINPPYYKKKPVTNADYAWYCGENGEYFQDLFTGMHRYMNDESIVLMVLCDGCDIPMIKEIASENQFNMRCVHSNKTLIEANYIFKIELARWF
ncbi:MAG: methyltransferase [Flavisolibacter sp.]